MVKKKTETTAVAGNREAALAAIKKKFGREVVAASDFNEPVTDVIPTGSLNLDIFTGIGGYPRGRVIEIYGPNASGKTTLTLHAIAAIQKQGGQAAFVDAECALDLNYAAAIGVDLSSLDYFRPETGEEALEVVETLTKSASYGLIVIDSVSALVPSKEVEGDIGDSHVGLQARLMGQALRKLTGAASKTGTTVMFLNQLRMKIGVMFGNPETTSGGNALAFYASLRLDVRRIGTLKSGDTAIGGRTRVKIIKNKLAGTAFNDMEFNMYSNNEHGAGISRDQEIFERAVHLGLVEKSGAWFSYQEQKLGQGSDNACAKLRESPDIMCELEQAIISQSNVRDEIKQRLNEAALLRFAEKTGKVDG